MSEQHNYSINLDVKYGFLELIDVPALIAACQEQWYNQALCQVNDCVVRLGVMQGKFLIDLEDKTITLEPHQGYAIPKGVVHRTRAPERAAILMVERSSVQPTGD
jgi:hypothetical protein